MPFEPVENDESSLDGTSYLKNEIRKRDIDIQKCATFGQQLLEEKKVLDAKLADLATKNEDLEQERYILQIELDASKESLKNHASEIEFLHDKLETSSKQNVDLQKEQSVILEKMANIKKQNEDMKKDQEDKHLEISALKNKIQLQEEQIKVFQNQIEVSLLDVTSDDFSHLKEDLNMYIAKHKELQDAFSECQYELETLRVKESRLNGIIKNLEEEVASRDQEIASYSADVRKTKEEMVELQEEVEMMRFQGVDFNKRGNSVYAELDDRRKLVEKEYKLLDAKFKRMRKDYDEKKQDLSAARMQMANLLCMKSFEHQQSYIDKLECDLKEANMEIKTLTIQLQKICKQEKNLGSNDKAPPRTDEYGYLRVMLQQAQKKEENMRNELVKQRIKNIALNEKLLETEEYLFQAKMHLESSEKENKKLQYELKEMETLQTLETNHTPKAERLQRIEILPGFNHDKSIFNAEGIQVTYLEAGRSASNVTTLGKDCSRIAKSPSISDKLTSNSTSNDDMKESNELSKLTVLNKTSIGKENKVLLPDTKPLNTKDEKSDENDNCVHQ